MAYRKPTGALLKALRPDTYRMVVELLAEPREHVSLREIERICGVGGNTIKAIERAGRHHPERKASCSSQDPPRRQRPSPESKAVSTTLPWVSLPGLRRLCRESPAPGRRSPTARLEVNVNLPDLYSEFLEVSRAIKQAVAKELPLSPLPALEAEIVEG